MGLCLAFARHAQRGESLLVLALAGGAYLARHHMVWPQKLDNE